MMLKILSWKACTMTLRNVIFKDRLVIVIICSELLLLEPLLGKSVACHFIVGYHPVLLEVVVPLFLLVLPLN